MKKNRLSRRNFLKLGATGAVALGLSPIREIYPAKAQEEGVVTIYWNPGHVYDTYQTVIDQFQEDFPGWTVNWEKYQWPDMRTKLLADFAADNPPDMTAEPGGWVQEFALGGQIRSLTEFIEADGEEIGFPSDWQDYTISRNMHEDEIYGMQIHLTCGLMFYNIDMLEEAGFSAPPTTWEEFLAVAQATAQRNVFGFAPNQATGYAWPWLLQNNVNYYDPDTNTVPMDTQDAIDAMQFQSDLIHVHEVAPIPIASADYEGPQKLFTANRAAMIITGPWDIKPTREGNPDLNWDVAPALTNQRQSTFAAGVSMMIPTGAKNPEMGWELMKRFTSLDAELAATQEAGMTMPRKSWAVDAALEEIPFIAEFGRGLGYAEDVTAELRRTGKYGEIDPLFAKAYEEIIYTNRPASEALAEFVEEANRILSDV